MGLPEGLVREFPEMVGTFDLMRKIDGRFDGLLSSYARLEQRLSRLRRANADDGPEAAALELRLLTLKETVYGLAATHGRVAACHSAGARPVVRV